MKDKQMFGLLTIVMVLAVFAALTPAAAADTLSGDRTISPTSVYAEDTFRVTVVVTIDGTVYGPVLNEAVPAGWTVTAVDNAGASYSAAETKWIWLDEVTGTKTVIYDVTVPAGTATGNYPVTGTVLATVGGSTIGPFDVTGANQVTVTDDGAADTLSGDRTISPTSVYAEDTFRVTVVVTIDGTVYGPVLNEAVPAGWTVTAVDNAGASYSAAETKWIWLDEVTGTKTVIYDVTVPAGTATGNYPVTGTVLATVGGSTIGPFDVTGANQVTVTDDGAADTLSGDRTISPTSVYAEDTFRVTVVVTIDGTVYGPVLNEAVPAGWTVTEVDNAGASYSAAETKWVWLDEVTGTKTVIYDVTVPAGTATGNYPVTGTVLATVGGSTIGPFDVTGANQVTVTECTCDFCLELEAGLNFVSIPKTLVDSPKNATTVFDVDYYSGEFCLYYDASAGSFDLNADVKPCRGFLVYKNAAKTVCADFDDTAPAPSQQLYEGWNMIGHIKTVAMPINDGTTADFVSITGLEEPEGNELFRLMATYTGTVWSEYPSGSLTDATPGAGYWIYMNQNVTMSGGFE